MSFLDESDVDNDGWDNHDPFDFDPGAYGFDALDEPPDVNVWELEEEKLDGRATVIDELSGHGKRYFSWENSKDKGLDVTPYQPYVFEGSEKGSTLMSTVATALGSDSREPTPSISPVQGASNDVSPNKKRRLRKNRIMKSSSDVDMASPLLSCLLTWWHLFPGMTLRARNLRKRTITMLCWVTCTNSTL